MFEPEPSVGKSGVDTASRLSAALRADGVELPDESIRKLSDYAALLAQWNSRVNLVSRKEGADGILSHILQSLAAGLLLALPDKASYFDLGTGGGFPGIPLAVFLPAASFVLCDSIGKKIRAVEDMTSALGLSNVRCLHARAEEAGAMPEHKGACDIVLSRAVAALSEVARLGMPLLRVDGPRMLIAWKGGDISRELGDLKRLRKVEKVTVTGLTLECAAEFSIEEKKLVEVRFAA